MAFTGTLKIATFFDIPVKLHWSFGLLSIYVLYIGISNQMGVNGTLFFGTFLIALFICVVLHEFGHALTAKKFDVDTIDIILLPIGGVARLTHLPKRPMHEFLIAIAGPAVNLAIALLLGIYLFIFREDPFLIQGNENTIYQYPANFIPLLLVLNITLIIFNMLPAFPMDGGRVLRALLSVKLGRLKATRIASILGQILAIVFLIYGFWNDQLILGLIGLFIFFSAGAEYKMVKNEFFIHSGKVGDIFRRTFSIINISDSLKSVFEKINGTDEEHYLVQNQNAEICGVLSSEAVQLTLISTDQDINYDISNLVSDHFEPIETTTTILDALKLFKTNNYTILPVFESRKLVGVLDIRTFSQV